MRYILGFEHGQLRSMATGIRLRHYQNPSDLPDYDEISEIIDIEPIDSDLSFSVSTKSSASIETICPSNKKSFRERQQKLKTEEIEIGRAIKICK
jgi:hypothetical protein